MIGLIIISVITLIIGNFPCSFMGIGNRSYSMYCESHFLIKKKGLLKLIYFKPKNFGCFSFFEVFAFFFSYIVFVVDVSLIILVFTNTITFNGLSPVTLSLCGCIFFVDLLWTVINDITNYREEKYFEKNDKGMSISTFVAKVHLYYDNNNKKVKSASEKCKQFFKNYTYSKLEWVEEKNTFAVISIDSPDFKDKIKLKY